jgi:hypothetical protein
MRWAVAAAIACACAAACARNGAGVDAPGATHDGAAADASPPSIDAVALPADLVPCAHPEDWPYSIASSAHPALVHYRVPDERAMAEQVLGLLDHSWDVEVGTLGFRPPLDDTGRCGPDGTFDAFLWAGHDECYVDVTGENAATPYDDRTAFLVVDPWGSYGSKILDTTVAHEFNHSLQAADDWSDVPIVYEMTAVFIEDLVYDQDNEYVGQIVDFQAHPDWSLDYNDNYDTWYMYGSALYLRFLRDRYWSGDGSFVGAMWQGLRSPADVPHPDFEDSLEALLRAKAGVGFVDSVVEFERWRVYTGTRDDGAHFREGATFAEPARLATVHTTGGSVALSPMELGTQYIELARGAGEPASVTVSLSGASTEVVWSVQAVPGPTLDLSGGSATVDASVTRTLVVTALPKGANDAATRSTAHHHATLVIAPK